MLRIAFDIGGVISKYPEKFRELCRALHIASSSLRCDMIDLHVITDMHDREKTLWLLKENGFEFIPEANVHNSDYEQYGNMCKAVLLKELKIDIFFDDFGAYTDWDSQLGEAPIRMLVQPDNFKPYWSDTWKTPPEDSDFGRRVAPLCLKEKPLS